MCSREGCWLNCMQQGSHQQAACLLGHAAPQYHGSHDLCSDGLKQVGPPRSTVAHIVPNQICNDCRIPAGRKQ